ncbi:hypothetical protein BG004_007702 [Podila humilis]|nr:hypothetical protein BG004_007702 [Podila humilis]
MARHGLLTPAGAKVIAGLILNYTLPALLFAKMLSCVNQDNAKELGLVAIASALILCMGGFFGIIIQKTGRVPKRLRRGIIAASMFTNFGDLPISVILAVSDHPPFLVGDGARGTAYSSVFIAVFYLFLFPFQGYRLIRYDHVKEAKRLASLSEVMDNGHHHHQDQEQIQIHNIHNVNSFSASNLTLAATADTTLSQEHRDCKQFELHDKGSSAIATTTTTSPKDQGLLQSPHIPHRQLGRSEQTTFSATSTMYSMDGPTEFYDEDHERRTRELRYHPKNDDTDSPPPVPQLPRRGISPPPPVASSKGLFSRDGSNDSLAHGGTNPFIVHAQHLNQDLQDFALENGSRANTLTNNGPHPQQIYSMSPLKAAGSPYSHVMNTSGSGGGADQQSGRHSVESMVSNGTGVSRFSSALDDDRRLVPTSTTTTSDVKRTRSRTNTGKGYRPPPLVQRPPNQPLFPGPIIGGGSGSSEPFSRPTSPCSPYISLTPPLSSGGSGSSSGSHSNTNSNSSGSLNGTLTNIPLESTETTPTTSPTTMSTTAPAATGATEPLPKVPPQLGRTHQSVNKHFLRRWFHGLCEYLTPPTLGLLLGLLVALTPLRVLFVVTDTPVASPDELPPINRVGGFLIPIETRTDATVGSGIDDADDFKTDYLAVDRDCGGAVGDGADVWMGGCA